LEKLTPATPDHAWAWQVSIRRYLGQIYCYLFPNAWLRRRLADDRWDELEVQYLPCLVDGRRAAIDVGANVGKYAYRLSKLTPRVYAFEPDADLAAKLRHALPKNVIVCATAASDLDGVSNFRVPLINGRPSVALASIESKNEAIELGAFKSTLVQTTRLDAIVKEPVGFIKIDVEGHELSVLKGGADILNNYKPVVLVEVENRHNVDSVADVRNFMHSIGYVGFFIFNGNLNPIEKFTEDMQSPAELARPVKRIEMNYVNNFLYVHNEDSEIFVTRIRGELLLRQMSQ
jgi:FkbM family methyltransferase